MARTASSKCDPALARRYEHACSDALGLAAIRSLESYRSAVGSSRASFPAVAFAAVLRSARPLRWRRFMPARRFALSALLGAFALTLASVDADALIITRVTR